MAKQPMGKQPLKKEITIFVKWTYDDDGTILYDYEEMAEGFAFELGLLENRIIKTTIKKRNNNLCKHHTGQPLN